MVTDSEELRDVLTAESEGLKSGKYVFDARMVLYSKIRPYLKKVARPDFAGLCSADVYPLVPIPTAVTRDFLYHLLLTPEFTDYAVSVSARAGMPKVNRPQLFAYQLNVPPLSEQRRIVAILDEAFAAIETATAAAEKNLANARELFESFETSEFDRCRSQFANKSIADIAENLDRQRVPITKSKRKAGSVPYYGASGEVDQVADFLFDEDLLLVSEDGANLLARTYPIAFSISGKSWVNNHAHVLRFAERAYQRYVEYYLNSISLAPYVSGMAQPKLNQAKLNTIELPWPDNVDSAQATVERLDRASEDQQSLIAIYNSKLALLGELKQSLLQKAFRGEI
jgi:type I restriction enzyme S subunit